MSDEETAALVLAARPELVGQRERLLAALAGIPVTQREVVLLHDLEEWTHAEIAQALEISQSGVSVTLQDRFVSMATEMLELVPLQPPLHWTR